MVKVSTKFCTWQALQSHAEVRYPNSGTTFRTDRCELLVWNCLHAAVSSNNDVARCQVVF